MYTSQKSMLSAVRAVLCAATLGAECMAGATPPTPPAVVELACEAQ